MYKDYTLTIGPDPIALGGPDITWSVVVTPKFIDLDMVTDLEDANLGDGLDIAVTCDTDPEWAAVGEVSAAFDCRPPARTSMSLGFHPPLQSRHSIWPIYGLRLDDIPDAKSMICDVVKEMYNEPRSVA